MLERPIIVVDLDSLDTAELATRLKEVITYCDAVHFACVLNEVITEERDDVPHDLLAYMGRLSAELQSHWLLSGF
jgi:hypothetical protein